MSAALDDFLDLLVRHGHAARRSGREWIARCPAHDDETPSLSIAQGDKGVVLICRTGCDTRDVVAALGIGMADLFDTPIGANPFAPAVAVATNSTMEWEVKDPTGAYVATHVRKPGKNGKKKYSWRRGDTWDLGGLSSEDLPLYACERLSLSTGPVVVTEGEKACDALLRRGIVAVGTVTGANSCPSDTSLSCLRGRSVIVWPDNDQPGKTHMTALAIALRSAGIAADVRVVSWSGAPPAGDAADFAGTTPDLRALLDSAKPYPQSPEPPPTADFVDCVDSTEPPWDVPIALADRAVPDFPTEVLPAWLAEWVEAMAESVQVPAALPAVAGLSVLSLATSRAGYMVNTGTWEEPTNLYTLVALGSGNRKSRVFSAAIAPIVEWERDVAARHSGEFAAARAAYDVRVKALEIAKANAAKGKPSKVGEVERLAKELDGARVPILPRLFAGDVTPEHLGTMLSDFGGTLGVLAAEGGLFETIAGRYADGVPNLDVWLNAHAGDPVRVDRGSRPPVVLDRPAITLCLTVQPDVVAGLARKPGFRGRGLLARFAYAIPRSLLGHRRVDAPAVPSHVTEEYRRRVRALLDLVSPSVGAEGGTAVRMLTLDHDARERLTELRRSIEPRLSSVGDLAHIEDWVGKYPGLVVRLAGLLHVGDAAAEESAVVSGRTFERAERIGAFFLAHALVAFDAMGADPAIERARHVLAWIRRTGTREFSRRDAFAALRGFRLLARSEDVVEAIGVLVEHGWIRSVPAEPRAGAGRAPSPRYAVSPFAHESTKSTQSDLPGNSVDPVDALPVTQPRISGGAS